MLFPKTKSKKSFAQTSSLGYGWPKTGKTTILSKLLFDGKAPLFIMSEDGEGILEISKARVKDWPSFVKLVDLLESKTKEVREQYSCFVLDLVSDLDTWAGEYIAKQAQVTHLSDMGFGKGFALQKEEFRRQLTRLMSILPCHFIAHTKEKEININGTPTKVQAPSLSTGVYEFLNGKVDTIMFIKPANGEQKAAIIIEPGLMAVTGSRFSTIIGSHEYDANDAGRVMAKIEKLFNKDEAKNV